MKTIDNRGICSLVMVVALSIGLGIVTHASANSYLVDLNSRTATELLTGNGIDPIAINDAGQVAGNFPSYRIYEAFITGPNGMGSTILGTLPGRSQSYAHGINNAGQVVGDSGTGPGTYCCFVPYHEHAFITGPNGVGMTDLGTLGGVDSSAGGINDAGQVVGYSDTADGSSHAFITGPNGVGMTDLGTLGGVDSRAGGINAAGQVVGYSDTADGSSHAFITGANGVGMADLGTLPGGNSSIALGINAAGQVVGNSYADGGSSHAFITGANGVGMTDLGTLGGDGSRAYGINDAGQVVGYSDTADGSRHAFITGPDGVGMTDLNVLVHLPDGFVMDAAFAINNMGQMTVSDLGPVIIPAVPEPESYALMLAGLVLTGVMVRRKQKAGGREKGE